MPCTYYTVISAQAVAVAQDMAAVYGSCILLSDNYNQCLLLSDAVDCKRGYYVRTDISPGLVGLYHNSTC